jgi:hypothetical protein
MSFLPRFAAGFLIRERAWLSRSTGSLHAHNSAISEWPSRLQA